MRRLALPFSGGGAGRRRWSFLPSPFSGEAREPSTTIALLPFSGGAQGRRRWSFLPSPFSGEACEPSTTITLPFSGKARSVVALVLIAAGHRGT